VEIGCVDCLHGCVWDWKKPSISDDGGGAGGQHIRHNVVLHSHTTERRPRQHANLHGQCLGWNGLRHVMGCAGLHRADEDRGLSVRGNQVGFRHVGEMPASCLFARITQGGDDGRVYQRKHDRSRFSRHGDDQHRDEGQLAWHWITQHNSARDGIWTCGIYHQDS